MQKKTLMGSLPVYAQHLSEQTGVKVVVEGSQAYTDGTKVVVPFTETDPELSFGYVAHECSHVRNTDMQYFGEAQAVPFRLSVLNILEDIRIERLSMDQYPGTEGDLNHLVTVVLGDRLDPADVAQKPALHVVHDTLLLAGRWQVLGQDLEQPATVMLQAQEKLLGAQLSARIMQKVGEVLQCDSTREVLALADAILALLPSQEDPQDKGGSDQQEQPPQENSQDDSGGGQGDQQDQEQPDSQPQEGDDASASEAITGGPGEDLRAKGPTLDIPPLKHAQVIGQGAVHELFLPFCVNGLLLGCCGLWPPAKSGQGIAGASRGLLEAPLVVPVAGDQQLLAIHFIHAAEAGDVATLVAPRRSWARVEALAIAQRPAPHEATCRTIFLLTYLPAPHLSGMFCRRIWQVSMPPAGRRSVL
ncbi:hypothetical protein V2S84_01970 [Azotobacter chroococcum]|nr:hypothetical protein [Azotobacter chroococcum]